jgi:hypothetical protein
MLTTNQLNRLRKDSSELNHYIHKLNKKGKLNLAHKVEKKRDYLESYISDLQNSFNPVR